MSTRKDYENMAHTISRHYRDANRDRKTTIELLVRDLCVDFKCENPRFDRVKFLTACGIDGRPS